MEIKPQYAHSKYGQFMFDLCAKGTKFIIKHRGLYYVMACTGGILLTAIGGLITLVLAIAKIFCSAILFEKYYGIYCIKLGQRYGGGMEMGLMFCRDYGSSEAYINRHEGGHSFQNTLFGPLTPFLIAIPSAARYWLIEGFPKHDFGPYDSVGFEDAATQCGEYAVAYLNAEKVKKESEKSI